MAPRAPILKLTTDQSNALEKELNQLDKDNFYKCFIIMRCWHPRAEKVFENVKMYNPDEVILLPLYPQYQWQVEKSVDLPKLKNGKIVYKK